MSMQKKTLTKTDENSLIYRHIYPYKEPYGSVLAIMTYFGACAIDHAHLRVKHSLIKSVILL